jgi:hypothetical protein
MHGTMHPIEDLMALGFTRRQVDTAASKLGYPKANEYPDEVRNALLERQAKKGRSKAQQVAEDAAEQQVNAAMEEDLKDIDEGAQRRAAAMCVGRDALTLYYLATGKFSIPDLKDAVDGSRDRLKSALRGDTYEPEAFLSPMVLDGTTGTKLLPTGNSETLPDCEPSTESEPLPI